MSAWRGLADVCKQYLAKGRKVCVIGSVHKHEYRTKNGDLGASLEVQAQDVEFLSSAAGQVENTIKSPENNTPERDPQMRYEKVDVDNELPF